MENLFNDITVEYYIRERKLLLKVKNIYNKTKMGQIKDKDI